MALGPEAGPGTGRGGRRSRRSIVMGLLAGVVRHGLLTVEELAGFFPDTRLQYYQRFAIDPAVSPRAMDVLPVPGGPWSRTKPCIGTALLALMQDLSPADRDRLA